jgi:interleukin-1 receptor-associated kinase 1
MDIQIEPISTVLHRVFTHQQLADATHNFSEDEKLGQGSFGSVYRGRLLDVEGPERQVAVKRIADVTAPLAKNDFDNEVSVMSPLNHRNIVRLVGWCQDESNLLLVYELMEKGNLGDLLYNSVAMDTDLHGITNPGTTLLLDWEKRYAPKL